jgi:hypothetical protein
VTAVLKLWFAFVEESLDSFSRCVSRPRRGNLGGTDGKLREEIFADRLVQELLGEHLRLG